MEFVSKLAVQALGKTEHAGLADVVGQLIGDHVPIDSTGGGVIGILGMKDCLLRVRQYLPQQDRFKLPAKLADFFLVGQLRTRCQPVERQFRGVHVRCCGRDFHVSE